jgi:PAS domain S-box-containing protein
MSESSLVIARESMTFEPVAHSASQARRAVVATLLAVHQGHHAEAAGLATSELVTNAILHAGSDIVVTITVTAALVLVEVEDRSPMEPTRRQYDVTATTGRGMALVQGLTADSGVRRVPGSGKVVWFTLGQRGWFFAGNPSSSDSELAEAARTVQLLGVPVLLYCAFQQVADGLMREYILATSGLDSGSMADLDEWTLGSEAFAELAACGESLFSGSRADEPTDLLLRVGQAAAIRFAALERVLARAVAMAHAGQLLAVPTQPEIVAVGEWLCQEVQLQLRGEPATAWRSLTNEHAPPGPRVDWDATGVTESPLAMVAADDANRIIAMSDAAVRLLGWEREDLVGRRIVTIVPPELREAHIAGFVRYLISGQPRILGSPVSVPALRRDGSQVPVSIRIDNVTAGGGRQVFVATLTPTG